MPNLWKTYSYVDNKIDCYIRSSSGFGGYTDWTHEDFDAKISVRSDYEQDFKNFTVGTYGLCVVCGKEIASGLYCQDCQNQGEEICDECDAHCDSMTGVYNRQGEYVHVCNVKNVLKIITSIALFVKNITRIINVT